MNRLTACCIVLIVWALSGATTIGTNDMETTKVEIKTTAGDIVVELYNDTPLHRDNFLKLAAEGFYDNVLFHRVIKDFMIQSGDPDSRTAAPGDMLGSGSPGYDIEAEIDASRHFHKRGALAAARQDDEVNPERRSSGSQFYIVTGRVFNDGQLKAMERRANLELERDIQTSLNAQYRDSLMTLRRERNLAALRQLQDEIVTMAEKEAEKNRFSFTPEQREAYTTIGGAPNLDGGYTVFGEVVSGMDVVDRISAAETDTMDRPKDDIRIISCTIVGGK